MRQTASKILDGFSQGGLLLAFWALGVIVFSQFFFRSFLNISLGWTEELARYLMIATAFLGLPVVTRRGEHIAIEMLSDAVKPSIRRVILIAAEILMIVIIAILAWQSKALAELSSQMMSALPLPKSMIYYVVFAGLNLQLLASLDRLVGLVRRDTPKDIRS